MATNPDNGPRARSQPSDADVRTAASVLIRSAYQFLRRLPNEDRNNFRIHLHREHYLNLLVPPALSETQNHNNEVVTREILIRRAQLWINNLPLNLTIRYTLKGYLERFSERDQHFQALFQALPQGSRQILSQIHSQTPVEALRQPIAPRQERIQNPLGIITRVLSRVNLEAAGPVPRRISPQLAVRDPTQVNQMALNIPEDQAGYVCDHMLAVYDDCLNQKYTDLKIVCRGVSCIFHVHRLVVCSESTYLREAVAALAPGEVNINLPDAEPAIMQLVIDTMYIRQFNTGDVLEGVNNNHFLILMEVYAMSKKYGIKIGMDTVLGGLPDVMQDVMFKLNLRRDERSPPNMALAHRAVAHITKALKFLSENPEACDDMLKPALRRGFLDNWNHLPSQEMHDALLAMPANFLDSLN